MASFLNTRALVEGAFMAGLTTVMGLLGIIIPPILIVMPIPLAVLVMRRDLRVAVLSLAVTGILMTILYANPLQAAVLLIQFGPLGLVLGLLYKNYVTAGHALVTASLISVIASVAVIALVFLIGELNLATLQAAANTSLDKVFQMYQQAGLSVPPEEQKLLRDSIKTAVSLLPAIWVLSSVLSTILTYIIGSKVLKRLGYKVSALPPFSQWRLPWYSIWGLILGLSFFMAGAKFNLNWLNITGQNLLMIFGFSFFVVGLSVVVYYFKVLPLSKPFKTIMIVLLFIYIGFMYWAVAVLGIFDAIFNIRRPLIKKEI